MDTACQVRLPRDREPGTVNFGFDHDVQGAIGAEMELLSMSTTSIIHLMASGHRLLSIRKYMLHEEHRHGHPSN